MERLPRKSCLLCTMILVLLHLLIPAVGSAETLKLFYKLAPDCDQDLHPLPRQIAKKEPVHHMFLEVNENGDVVMHHANVTITMAYNSPDDVIRSQDRVAMDLQPRDCSMMSGISLKMGFSF